MSETEGEKKNGLLQLVKGKEGGGGVLFKAFHMNHRVIRGYPVKAVATNTSQNTRFNVLQASAASTRLCSG